MMKAQIPLRIGLGLTYVYSGLGLIRKPEDWLHFVPNWLLNAVDSFELSTRMLQLQGVGELLLGVLLLLWFMRPKLLFVLAILGAFHVALILLLGGVDLVTFRDIGLLGAWIALVVLAREKFKIENQVQ